MKTFIMAVIALFALQLMATPSPEQMYDSLDKDGKYRQMQEQLDQVIEKSEQAEKEKATKQQIALWAALAIGFIPLYAIGKQVLSKRTWEENPSGTCQALGIALAGAVALFGLNYGIFLLKIEYGSSFNSVMAVALVLLLTIAAIYVVRKK